jgi:hypothetical protein
MRRRDVIALLFIPVLKGDGESEVWAVVASMASALAENNAPGFLKPVDRNMPGYADLSTNVEGLVQQADVKSSISPLSNEGTESARTLRVDWELRMYPRGGESPLSTDTNSQGNIARMQRREQAVTLQFRRVEKKWQVSKIEPIAFFAPPEIH